MGILFSREKSDSKDYEQVLSKLDIDIQKVEGRLSEIKIKQRKASFMWIIYSLVIWILCALYLFYQFVNGDSTTQDIAIATTPVVLMPVGIYHVRKLLVWWYDQRQKKEETNLSKLRKEQKDKLEDLKKKTSYYTTQSLLERYDDALLKKKKEEQQRLQQQQQQQQRKPVSMPPRQLQQPQRFPNAGPVPGQPLPPPGQQQQQQQQQPILPPARSEPQWYDKIVDALVGDAGPETKYALICNHCYHHNGLVLKEEFDTIQYICPVCKQFNPSRKSKQMIIPQQQQQKQADHEKEPKRAVHENEDMIHNEDKVNEEVEEEDTEEVLAKLKAEYLNDEDSTIASRVRQRHTHSANSASDTE
ncbi:unnamed protein product [Mucor circinelloides]|uniref:Endoplasmic reticulum junction formation protein lunapark n=1 Tax=Mucor circinelloides f. circinelloides (strain 1006PhL) TaxID=1220926 RepID=S2K1P2_MUCC1|nr:hypothetical protein HMPREF1544_07161 [Mucor circinelloides 1006PhL]KAG1100423.1 hypothetical protein G6F42_017668 [Rhizopus arrhizus]